LPDKVSLYQNYPNPFNPYTTIRYALTLTSNVNLSIFDVEGRKIITLVSERQQAGEYTVEWDPTQLASGVYYGCLKVGSDIKIIKIILLR